jgi:hypothetical protein
MNLDDFDPGYEPVPTKLRKGARAWLHYVKTRRVSGWTERKGIRPGVHPNKMRDWRSLERRRHELWKRQVKATHDFWNYMRDVGGPLQEGAEKWIMFNENEICRYSGSGYSMDSAKYLLKDLLKPKSSYGPYQLVKVDEGGHEAGVLRMRMNRAIEFWRVYDSTFKQALEDRLRQYAESVPADRYRDNKIFLVKNEGRTTVAMIDYCGRITFPEGIVEEFA